MSTAVWWIRRDLRLTDNQALHAALDAADEVIPLIILDPVFEASPMVGAKRLAFYYEGLRRLDADLRQSGSALVVRRGEPAAELGRLLSETGATAVFAEADYSITARRRDERVARTIPLHLQAGVVVHPPDSVLKQDGAPYQVFTPFKKNAWLTRPLPQADHLLPAPSQMVTRPDIPTHPIPEIPILPTAVPFAAGEAEAHRRLKQFTQEAVEKYAQNRNLLAVEGTSRLSPYLRFGMISARQTAVAALQAINAAPHPQARKGAETWLSELIWREFYISILAHFPHVAQGSFRPEYDQIAWRNDAAEFEAWKNGHTGYPVVDAAMRQLAATGWMHNRARMIVASFLVKDLLIDWRWGERFFMQQLVDGDPASNNGGWQWTAGTGTDAAPYFRIFNPVSQSRKFDPEGVFIRRWLPELADAPDKYVHTPWEMPSALQLQVSVRVGKDYPRPLVDHAQARERTLAAYQQARGQSSGQQQQQG